MKIFNKLFGPGDLGVCIAALGFIGACACAYTRPACKVISVANEGCSYFLVEYEDKNGNKVVEQVPKSELRAVAERARRARLFQGRK